MDGKQDCSPFPQCIPVKSGNRTEWNLIRPVMITDTNDKQNWMT